MIDGKGKSKRGRGRNGGKMKRQVKRAVRVDDADAKAKLEARQRLLTLQEDARETSAHLRLALLISVRAQTMHCVTQVLILALSVKACRVNSSNSRSNQADATSA